MKIERLAHMTKGWFIGDFNPTLYATKQFEIAVKRYSAGDHEQRHIHKIATEFTVIVTGTARMNEITIQGGDIVVLEPGESSDFLAVTDVVSTVVKIPCVAGDKYEEAGEC